MLLSLLSLASAGYTAPAAGGFSGGAFIGAHAGFNKGYYKELAKANPAKEADVKKVIDLIAGLADADFILGRADDVANKKAFDDASAGVKDGVLTVKVDATGAADVKAASSALVDALTAAAKSVTDYTKVTSVKVFVLSKDTATLTANTAAALKGAEAFTNAAKDDAKKAFVKTITDGDAEAKFTSNAGLVGLHAGYLARMGRFGVGAILRGNWVIGQDFKVDGSSTARADELAERMGADVLCRLVGFVNDNVFAGVDLGVGIREFRHKKDGAKSNDSKDKESKWLWAPKAGAVVGYAINKNMAVSLTAGGSLPIEQDGFNSRKVKAYDLTAEVGVSYYFA